MTFTEYQELARRTQQANITQERKLRYALCGLAAECRELEGVCVTEKVSKESNPKDRMLESGDILWLLSELCDVCGWDLCDMVRNANGVNVLAAYDDDFVGACGMALDGATAICGIFQKEIQGHPIDIEDVKIHIRFILLAIAVVNWETAEPRLNVLPTFSRVMEANIEKLKTRYPDGFSEEASLNREEYKA